MKRKGFTLVELLVVIAVIALLMGLLMPALARVRQIAYRMICGANLSSISKGMLLYAQDHDEEFPRSGDIGDEWIAAGAITDPFAKTRGEAYGKADKVTVTSCFYLLVRYADVTPKTFVCKGDDGTREFDLSEVASGKLPDHAEDVTDAWDFGGEPQKSGSALWPGMYCSYSYQLPFDDPAGTRGYPVTPISSPESPLCADRNPFLDKNALSYLTDDELDNADWEAQEGYEYYIDPDRKENAAAHQREGQNVLFNDGHVSHERYPNVGIRNDNIWKFWPTEEPCKRPSEVRDWELGSLETEPKNNGDYGPMCDEDAYLVGEKNAARAEKVGRGQ